MHKDHELFAVIFESARCAVWCEISGGVLKGKEIVVSNCVAEVEWEEAGRTERFAGAAVSELMAHFAALTFDRKLKRIDPNLLTMCVHDRFYQKWNYVNRPSPAQLAKERQGQRERLHTLVAEFVQYFRAFGLLEAAVGVTDAKLTAMTLEYDEDLFEAFQGVLVVVDDYDELEDVFSMEVLDLLPQASEMVDLTLLSILSPHRVWWEYRLCVGDDEEWQEGSPQERAELFLRTLAKVSRGAFDPRELREEPEGTGGVFSFVVADKRCEPLQLVQDDDVVLECLPAINESFGARSDSQFVLVDTRGSPGEEGAFHSRYVLFLSNEEVEKLRRDRGWVFS